MIEIKLYARALKLTISTRRELLNWPSTGNISKISCGVGGGKLLTKTCLVGFQNKSELIWTLNTNEVISCDLK